MLDDVDGIRRLFSLRLTSLAIVAAFSVCFAPADDSKLKLDTRPADESAELLRDLMAPDVLLALRPEAEPPVDESANYPLGDEGEEEQLSPLSKQQIALRHKVRRTLGLYYHRQLNSGDHNPWEMMHALIAYGVETQIHRGSPNGPRIKVLSYLAGNGPCHGLNLLFLDRGRINARKGPYVQGHYAQLLAILAQSRVPLSQPLRVGDKQFTVGDLLETEKRTCDVDMELTFKLISFAHYCDSDVTWTNFRGETWSLPRIIEAELAAPILSNAACGGTHRLTGMAYAVRNRKRQGKPIDGQWLRAEKYLADYHRYTLALQNSDGSFSTEWFRRREARPDLDRRIQTTGHILEWLVYSVPAEQLDHPQVVKAVHYLTNLLLSEQSREWEIGPLGHAIHALAIYDARRFKPFDGSTQVAKKNRTVKAASDSLAPSVTEDFMIGTAEAQESKRQPAAGSAVPQEARRPRRPSSDGSFPSGLFGSSLPGRGGAVAPRQATSQDPQRRLQRPLLKSRTAPDRSLLRRWSIPEAPSIRPNAGPDRTLSGEPTPAPEPIVSGPPIEAVSPGIEAREASPQEGEPIVVPPHEEPAPDAKPADPDEGPLLSFPEP